MSSTFSLDVLQGSSLQWEWLGSPCGDRGFTSCRHISEQLPWLPRTHWAEVTLGVQDCVTVWSTVGCLVVYKGFILLSLLPWGPRAVLLAWPCPAKQSLSFRQKTRFPACNVKARPSSRFVHHRLASVNICGRTNL